MEIKVRCVCGSLYSFDDEPVDGRLKFPVSCTNCGADGTEKAHAFIAAKLSGGPDPSEVPVKKGLSGWMGKKKSADEPVAVKSAAKVDDEDTSPARLAIAITGALLVGAVGAVGWFLLAKATGYEFGYAAWVLGAMVGVTARLLAPRGHHWLGLVGAAAALVAILGGQLLTANWGIGKLTDAFVEAAYNDAERFASRAAMAEDDDELREHAARYKLAKLVAGENSKTMLAMYREFQLAESFFTITQIIKRDRPLVVFAKQGEAANPENVTDAELAHFKQKVLPDLKRFADGKPTEQQYKTSMRKLISSRITLGSLIVASMGPFSWAWVGLGVVTAFKAAHRSATAF